MGARAGRARGLLPITRVVPRPARIDPERVDRVDFVLRAERVEGVRPEPVRVDAEPVDPVVVDAEGLAPGAARPHVSQ
jgi:hypothetical protein